MKGKRSSVLIGSLCVVLVLAVLPFAGACAPTQPTTAPVTAPATIKVGSAYPLSGWLASTGVMSNIGLCWTMWEEEVNAKGGLYVPEYDKKIPIELIIYDDKSDAGTTVKMYEKLMLEDKVDILLSCCCTGMLFAVAPLINDYKYPMIGTTGTSIELRKMAQYGMPYYFCTENQAQEINGALVNLLVDLGIKRVAVLYNSTLNGIDHTSIAIPLFNMNGIEVPIVTNYPLDIKDFTLLVQELQSANISTLIAYTYPEDAMLLQEAMMVQGYNPDLFLNCLSLYPEYRDKFGAKAVEGVINSGAWNKDVPCPGAADWYQRFVARWDREPSPEGAYHWPTCQIWEQVVAKVGLDREAQRDMLATETFPTIWGDVKFEGQYNCSDPNRPPGLLSQWQNGQLRIIAPKQKQELSGGAKPIFPKPHWPK